MTDRQTDRQTELDILRIVSMVMVTMLHITGHGLQNITLVPGGLINGIVTILNTFSLVAVNCFVLITGYFLSVGTMKLKKIVVLWIQVWMYSVGIYLFLSLIPIYEIEFSVKELVRCCFPILSNRYWYFTCYFLLYLLFPVLNILIRNLDKKMYQNILGVALGLFCIIPSINIFGDTFGTNHGYSLTWFIVLYLVAGYLRRYPWNYRINPLLMYIFSCIILCFIRIVGDLAGSWIDIITNLQLDYNSPIVLCASVSLLQYCTMPHKNHYRFLRGIVNKICPYIFGVYLLHDHMTMSKILWSEWVRLGDVVEHPIQFITRIVLTLIVLFTVGILVEWIRLNLFNNAVYLLRKGKKWFAK